MKKLKKLNARQKAFCEEYIIDLNATQAAIRVGYKEKNAGVTGCENLTKPNIASYIAELKAERAERTETHADYVLLTLREIVDISMGLVPAPEGFDPKHAISALQYIGKHINVNAFNENITITKGEDVTPWDSITASVDD